MISESMKRLVENSSTIRAMFEEGIRLEKLYGKENVFDFSIGNPNVAPPKEIKKIIDNILTSENPIEVHGYMNNSGYESVRETIAENMNKKFQYKLSYESVVMTCGAAGGLNILLKTLLNPKDEVIIFAPFFGEYINYINNYDGKVIIVETDNESFLPNIEKFSKAITERTKAVIINTPNNPTGVVYTKEILNSLSLVLREKEKEFGNNIYLISDEPYRELIYEDIQLPLTLKYHSNSFVCYSYSKSLSLPGERIGYILVNPQMTFFNEVVASLNIANRILGFVNAPSLFQKVIKEALDLEVDVSIYIKNRDFLYDELIKLGYKCNKPAGAFYLFPKSPIEDDVKFCEIAKQYNILAVPGSVFGYPGYFRLSYCIPYEKISKSISSFKLLINNL